MLVEFSFSNFRSFKDEATFSMEPVSQNGKNINVIKTNFKRVPQLFRTSGIFGANASGKSNIIKAFAFLIYMVKKSSKWGIDDRYPQEYYALAKDYEKQPIRFVIKFIVEQLLYDYKFTLQNNIIKQESLHYYNISDNGTNKANRVFERDYIEGKSVFKKSTGILQSWCNEIIDNRLFLSEIINNRKCEVPEVKTAYNWITKKIKITDSHKLNEGFSLNQIYEGKGNEIINMMKKADLGLESITVDQVPLDEILEKAKDFPQKIVDAIKNGKGKLFNRKSYHKTEDGELKEFDLDNMESEGTKNFLALIGPILDVLEQGNILITDEMDDTLHSYLVRYIVDMFNNPELNKNNAQLIFTSHAPYLMDGYRLTRDQIWLTTKELTNGFSSSLYSLVDLNNDEKRKNISFQEAYLDGIYGAVPNLEVL